MAPVTMGKLMAEFLVSEANGYRSREAVTVVAAADLEPGTILGRITANGNYVRHDAAAGDGSQTEAGILLEAIASGVTDSRTIIARDAEVSGADLTYEAGADQAQIDASNAALAGLGIAVR